MTESISLIAYKYRIGAYTLEDMIELVEKGFITKEDFFNITRYNFDGVKKTGGWLR